MLRGAKYFIKDKCYDYIISAQIISINSEEVSFKNLDTNEEFLRNLNDIEKISIITEEEAIRLNNQKVFSIQTELVRAIIGREELMNLADNNFDGINKDENTVLISIYDPDRNELPEHTLSKFSSYLSIGFWDMEEEIGRYKPISEENAKKIKEFILENKDKNFIINCEAGISRSAGVGLAVFMLIEFDGDKYAFATSYNPIKDHIRYSPNYKVFDMIVDN